MVVRERQVKQGERPAMRADPEKPWRNNLDRQDSRDKATGEGTSRCPPSPRKGMTIRARKPPKTKENYTALAENVTELGSAEIRVEGVCNERGIKNGLV